MKKSKWITLLLILCFISLLSLGKASYLHETEFGKPGRFVYEKGITYSLGDDYIHAFIASISPNVEDLVIPGVVDGRPVHLEITFECPENAKSLTIEEGVQGLQRLSFINCFELESIDLFSSHYEDFTFLSDYDEIRLFNCPKLKHFALTKSHQNSISALVSQCPSLTNLLYSDNEGETFISHPVGPNFIEEIHLYNTASLADNSYIQEGVTYKTNIQGILYLAEYPKDKTEFSFTIPKEVTLISPEGHFDENLHLKNLHLSPWVNSFFLGKNRLSSITVESTSPYFKSINGVLFNLSGERLIAFPGEGFTDYTIPLSTQKVDDFYSYSLERLAFPEGMEKMPAFYEYDFFCPSLTTITLPDTMKSIDPLYSLDLPSLKSIEVSPNHPFFKSINGALFSLEEQRLLYYPAGLEKDDYSIPEGTRSIHPKAFNQVTHLKSLTFPSTIRALSPALFENTTSPLEAYHIAASGNPFYYSNGGIIYTVGQNTLLVYPKERKNTFIDVPLGTKKIGPCAFSQNPYIEKVTLPYTTVEIGDYAFAGCSGLKTLSLPPTLHTLGAFSFLKCGSLEKIILPNSLSAIGPGVFAVSKDYDDNRTHFISRSNNFNSLLEITLPSSIQNIDNTAFSGRFNEELRLIVQEHSPGQAFAQSNEIPYYVLGQPPLKEPPKKAYALVLPASPALEEDLPSPPAPIYISGDSTLPIGHLAAGSVVELLTPPVKGRYQVFYGNQGFFVSEEDLLLFTENNTSPYQYYGESATPLDVFSLYPFPSYNASPSGFYPKDTRVEILAQLGPWYQVRVEDLQSNTSKAGYVPYSHIRPVIEPSFDDLYWSYGVLTGSNAKGLLTPIYLYPDKKAPQVRQMITGSLVPVDFFGGNWYKTLYGYVSAENIIIAYIPIGNG